jgi:hypothetical protein
MAGHDDSHANNTDAADDIIAEGSIQDKILILLSMMCLIGLIAFGVQFARMQPIDSHAENHEQHESHLK